MADLTGELPVTMKVYSQSGTFLTEFPYFTNLQVQDTINGVGSFTFNWNYNSPGASYLISDTALQMAVCMDYKDGNGFTEVFRGWYEQDTYDPANNESAIVQASGRSMVAVLDQAIVYPQGGVGSTTTSWSFTGASVGTIMNTLINAAKTRGCFPGLSVSFTNGADSSGNAWTEGYTNAFSAGTSYLNLLTGLAQGGLCDFNMTGQTLNIYNAFTTLATDRSSTVVLRRSRDVITIQAQRDRSQISTAVLAVGDNGLNAEITASTYGTLGRYETYLAETGITDHSTLVFIADQQLATMDDQKLSYTATDVVPLNLGAARPWKDFNPGDYISLDYAGTPVKFRCTQWTIQAQPGGPTMFQPTLNDVFYTREVLMQNALQNFAGGVVTAPGGVAVTGGGGTPAPGPNPTVPGVPAFNTASCYTAAYFSPATGTTLAQLELNWTTPTNTDGTTMIDGNQYIVQYRLASTPIYPIKWSQLQGKAWSSINGNPWTNPLATPQNQQWTTVTVSIDNNNVIIGGLICGETYQFQIACTDVSGNTGAFSAITSFATATDNVAPGQPDAPQVSASMVAVQVIHDLQLYAGGPLPQDINHLEVHYSYDPSFTPVPGVGSTTYLGKIHATGGMVNAGIAAMGNFNVTSTSGIYIKVIAVDESGNSSVPSPSSGVTAVLIDDTHISSLSVTKLIAGTISASVVLASSIYTNTSGARVGMDGTTDALYTYDNNGVLIGAWAGLSGSDPSTGRAYQVGWSIFNDYGNGSFAPGYLAAISNTPNTNYHNGSPTLVFSSDPSQSTKEAQIYSNSGVGWETLRIDSSVSQSSVDASLSQVWIEMNGAFATNGAQGHLHYKNSSGDNERLMWDHDGLTIDQGYPGTPIIGRPIQHTGIQGGGLQYRFITWSVSAPTTDSSGHATFSHGAPFTPSFFLSADANGSNRNYYFDNITSTTARVTAYNANGSLAASTLVNFWYGAVGDH